MEFDTFIFGFHTKDLINYNFKLHDEKELFVFTEVDEAHFFYVLRIQM